MSIFVHSLTIHEKFQLKNFTKNCFIYTAGLSELWAWSCSPSTWWLMCPWTWLTSFTARCHLMCKPLRHIMKLPVDVTVA